MRPFFMISKVLLVTSILSNISYADNKDDYLMHIDFSVLQESKKLEESSHSKKLHKEEKKHKKHSVHRHKAASVKPKDDAIKPKKEEIIDYEAKQEKKPVIIEQKPKKDTLPAIVIQPKEDVAKPQMTPLKPEVIKKEEVVSIKPDQVKAPDKQEELPKQDESAPITTKPISDIKPKEVVVPAVNTIIENKAQISEPKPKEEVVVVEKNPEENIAKPVVIEKPVKSEQKLQEIVAKPSSTDNGTLLGIIEFEKGAVELTPAMEKKTSSFIEKYKKSSNSRIRVVGYSSSDQDPSQPDTSRRIALQRVVSVRKYMIANNIDHLKITVQAIGESTDKSKPNNRIEVFIE